MEPISLIERLKSLSQLSKDAQASLVLISGLLLFLLIYQMVVKLNFRYTVAGIVFYPLFRELEIVFHHYLWMIDSSNLHKIIFGLVTLVVAFLFLIFTLFSLIKPLLRSYRNTIYELKGTKIWNPILLSIIWIIEAIIIHYAAYTPFLSDNGLKSYPGDAYLLYYASGIGLILTVFAFSDLKLIIGSIIEFLSNLSNKVYVALIKLKDKRLIRFKNFKNKSDIDPDKVKEYPSITTIVEDTIGNENVLTADNLDPIGGNSLLDMKDGNFHYRKVKEISRGGFGVVYLVKNMKSDKYYAAKCPHMPFSSNAERVRFQREVNSQSSIQHQNVVKLIHTLNQDNLVYIIMEYVEGIDLRKIINKNINFDLNTKINLMSQILNGLIYVHSNQIIHRDIKPSNILIARDGTAKITDFGIAKIITDTQITVTGSLMGTPDYMSPEQHRGEKVDVRTDIYSIGLTFYHFLAGDVLYPTGGNSNDIYYFKKNGFFKPLSQIDKTIPVNLSKAIEKAINFDRNLRYDSALAFKQAMINAVK